MPELSVQMVGTAADHHPTPFARSKNRLERTAVVDEMSVVHHNYPVTAVSMRGNLQDMLQFIDRSEAIE